MEAKRNPMNDKMVLSLITLITALFFIGCGEEELDPRSYIDRVEDKEGRYQVEQTVGGTTYLLRHRPAPYAFLKQKGPEGSTPRSWEEEKRDYKEGVRFALRVRPSSSSPEDWVKKGGLGKAGERTRYFSFGMKEDLELIGRSDTLSCSTFHFERTYGHTPYLSFLFSFSREELPEGPHTVRFENSMSRDGPVKFHFDEGILTDPPGLTLNER